ncbi:MAG: DUF1192 domain-containing protein [Rhizobiales bacterium]|nr:DUF1192 domain-containing protein [Hyphomicrobiales bacterium]
MFDDSEPQRKKSAFTIGQDVSAFSIADLDETIEALKAEMVRLAETRAKKTASQSAADALFRKPG